MAKKELTTYKFFPGTVTPSTNLYPNAFAIIDYNKKFIIEEAISFIQTNIDLTHLNKMSFTARMPFGMRAFFRP